MKDGLLKIRTPDPAEEGKGAHDRILKVSRTLADLSGKQEIVGNEVPEAIQFRSPARRLLD